MKIFNRVNLNAACKSILVVLIIITTLCGCQTISPVSESQIQDDLQNYDIYPFNLDSSAYITDFSIAKRKTDKSNGVDTIYLDVVEAENEDARFVQSYIMHYSLYNEGWLLDDIQMSDTNHRLNPLRKPSNQEIESIFLSYYDRTGYECESWEIAEQTIDYNQNLCTVQFKNMVIKFIVSGVEGHWRGVSATVRYRMDETGTWSAIDNLEDVY